MQHITFISSWFGFMSRKQFGDSNNLKAYVHRKCQIYGIFHPQIFQYSYTFNRMCDLTFYFQTKKKQKNLKHMRLGRENDPPAPPCQSAQA